MHRLPLENVPSTGLDAARQSFLSLLSGDLQQAMKAGDQQVLEHRTKSILVGGRELVEHRFVVGRKGHEGVRSESLLRVDPKTMAMQEFKLPEGGKVRRLALTSDGMLWYGNDGLGTVGRLDTKTGQTKEWPSPSGPKSQPYGIVQVNGIIWYNESAIRPNTIVRFDPKTEKFQSWAIPSGVGIIRHMRKTPDGNLTIHQTSSNRIGLAIIGKQTPPAAAR